MDEGKRLISKRCIQCCKDRDIDGVVKSLALTYGLWKGDVKQ